jgi:hypothetical protein
MISSHEIYLSPELTRNRAKAQGRQAEVNPAAAGNPGAATLEVGAAPHPSCFA